MGNMRKKSLGERRFSYTNKPQRKRCCH